MNAQDLDDLQAFVDRVERLRRSRVFRGGQAATFEIGGSLGGPASMSTTEPEEEMIEAALAILRPLLAQGGPTSLHHVFNLCQRHLDDSDLRHSLERIRAVWKRAQKEGSIKLVINDEHWRPEVIADLIINGYFAHDDPGKRQRLRGLGVVETMLTRTVFVAYFVDAAKAAISIANVLIVGLRDSRFR